MENFVKGKKKRFKSVIQGKEKKSSDSNVQS